MGSSAIHSNAGGVFKAISIVIEAVYFEHVISHINLHFKTFEQVKAYKS